MPIDRVTQHLVLQIISTVLSTRAAAMGIAFVLAIAGCSMIFSGIKDEGSIDLRTPLVTGQAKSGFVGALLVFGSLVISVICVLSLKSPAGPKVPRTNQRIVVRNGDMQLEWEGELQLLDESKYVVELLKSAQMSLLRERKRRSSTDGEEKTTASEAPGLLEVHSTEDAGT